jgi:hypothetical protein
MFVSDTFELKMLQDFLFDVLYQTRGKSGIFFCLTQKQLLISTLTRGSSGGLGIRAKETLIDKSYSSFSAGLAEQQVGTFEVAGGRFGVAKYLAF